MLGKPQLARFMNDIKRSKATFKVIMNEIPIQKMYFVPYDRWEGYNAEREALLTFLQANVKNVVFLTTDLHATLINDVRFKTLEPGGPQNSGILEATVGPAATASFAQEINAAVGLPFAAPLVDNLFFEPQPPSGLGMQCSGINQFSYGEVAVTSTQLTITPKDIARQSADDRRRCLRAVRLELPALTSFRFDGPLLAPCLSMGRGQQRATDGNGINHLSYARAGVGVAGAGPPLPPDLSHHRRVDDQVPERPDRGHVGVPEQSVRLHETAIWPR